MSRKGKTSANKPVTLFVLHIDALSPETLTHLRATWQVSILEHGTTAKHGLSFVRFSCPADPPEAFLEYLDGQMNVLDYVIEGRNS